MPGQGRLGDKANAPVDAHGCVACPHPTTGPAIQGSPDVNVNRRPALRIDDPGAHMACCGTNTWVAKTGSATVFINGKGAHRMGDQTRHCGGMGQLIEGSPNVMVGESTSRAGDGRGAGSTRRDHGGDDNGREAPYRSPAAVEAAAMERGETRSPVTPTSFVAISLVDQHDEPVGYQRYRVSTSDGQIREGTLDAVGKVQLDGIAPGTCQVSFPDLDANDWKIA